MTRVLTPYGLATCRSGRGTTHLGMQHAPAVEFAPRRGASGSQEPLPRRPRRADLGMYGLSVCQMNWKHP